MQGFFPQGAPGAEHHIHLALSHASYFLPSDIPHWQAEEGTRRLLSAARETRPRPPRSSVRPSQPPAASSRCGSLTGGKSRRWDGVSSRCYRHGEWAIGQPLHIPLSLPPPSPLLTPSIPCLHTRGSARSLFEIPHLRPLTRNTPAPPPPPAPPGTPPSPAAAGAPPSPPQQPPPPCAPAAAAVSSR